jgi:hypothetical protein
MATEHAWICNPKCQHSPAFVSGTLGYRSNSLRNFVPLATDGARNMADGSGCPIDCVEHHLAVLLYCGLN